MTVLGDSRIARREDADFRSPIVPSLSRVVPT